MVTPRAFCGFVICAAALFAFACGSDDGNGDISTFEVEIESSGGELSTISASFDEAELIGSATGAFITPGVLYVELGEDADEGVELQILTSDSDTAPGTFAIESGQANAWYDAPDEERYRSTGPGTITLETCPRSLDEHAVGTFSGIEVSLTDSEETKIMRGSFDIAIVSMQTNGNDEPLHCG